MKKYIVQFIFILLTINSFSQEKIHAYRELTKLSMNDYIVDDDMLNFNSYLKDNDFYWDLEYNLKNITYPEYLEIEKSSNNIFLKDLTENTLYDKIFHVSNVPTYVALISKSEFEKIYFKITYKTSDFRYIKFNYYINSSELVKLAHNINRDDFYNILHKL